jgi:hypothetical protein
LKTKRFGLLAAASAVSVLVVSLGAMAPASATAGAPWEDPNNGDVSNESLDPDYVASTNMWNGGRLPTGGYTLDSTQPLEVSKDLTVDFTEATCTELGYTWENGACDQKGVLTITETQVTSGTANVVANSNTTTSALASVPRPVKCRDWSQKLADYTKLAWQEKHTGRFCYDGSKAWVSLNRNYSGWHDCGISRGVGFSVENKVCSVRNDPSAYSGNAKLQMYDQFKVTFIARGFPISGTCQMFANAYPSGNIYYHHTNC